MSNSADVGGIARCRVEPAELAGRHCGKGVSSPKLLHRFLWLRTYNVLNGLHKCSTAGGQLTGFAGRAKLDSNMHETANSQVFNLYRNATVLARPKN